MESLLCLFAKRPSDSSNVDGRALLVNTRSVERSSFIISISTNQ